MPPVEAAKNQSVLQLEGHFGRCLGRKTAPHASTAPNSQQSPVTANLEFKFVLIMKQDTDSLATSYLGQPLNNGITSDTRLRACDAWLK